MKELKLSLPVPPSLNSAYRNVRINCRIPTIETKMFMRKAADIAFKSIKNQSWKMSEEKTVVEMTFFWKDKRKRDCDNYKKVVLDSLKKIVFKDDNIVLDRTMNYFVDKENPRLELRIYLLDNENRQ
jgi:crossover junction endodeoxyribonuclease RusA